MEIFKNLTNSVNCINDIFMMFSIRPIEVCAGQGLNTVLTGNIAVRSIMNLEG